MKIIEGDLLSLAADGHFDVIVQGCNCFCTMGSGLAKQIKEKYPEAYEADCQTKKGDKEKLGTYTTCVVGNLHKFVIVNAYTQFNYGKSSKDYFEYYAFQ